MTDITQLTTPEPSRPEYTIVGGEQIARAHAEIARGAGDPIRHIRAVRNPERRPRRISRGATRNTAAVGS
ncbi:hypothetical protein [Embleya sp. NPDC005575]|uniref:hypothetical protein n=1 Tax=Embleya sp. NPDC005575 TaxID=3156892 RepID=UPI0033B05242